MIKITGDGSSTLIHPIIGDSYHSLYGAVAESEHIYIGAGLGSVNLPKLSILEIGFGSGLNALLTLEAAQRSGQRVEYSAIELYPIEEQVAEQLSYASSPHFLSLHKSEWGRWVDITPTFRLKKIRADLVGYNFEQGYESAFNLVYFDAFAPESQPELWSEDIFRAIYNSMASVAVLVTYSSKGVVKRALRSVGFQVSRLAGPEGKRHIIRAVK